MTDADAGVIVALGPDGTALLVTESSLSLRQATGPVAWSALELLALSAQLDARGALVVAVGVRDLAAQLGVGRDATANALSHLRELGLISASQQRAGRGRFDGTRHTILLPVLTEPSRNTRTRSSKTARLRRAQRTASPTSPSLFDDPTDPPTDPPTAARTDATDASDSSSPDHSTPVPEDLPKKLHELAFNRMPSAGDAGGVSC